jgi:hypothetical protein
MRSPISPPPDKNSGIIVDFIAGIRKNKAYPNSNSRKFDGIGIAISAFFQKKRQPGGRHEGVYGLRG